MGVAGRLSKASLSQAQEGRVRAWMRREGLVRDDDVTTSPLGNGTQNEIFEVRSRSQSWVLRIPPADAPASRDRGIEREWRIVHALEGSAVPHARAVRFCADRAVLGRPFLLSSLVVGWAPVALEGWPEPFGSEPSIRPGLAEELIAGIATISRFDWRQAGLGDLGRPDGFHERQVARWTGFHEEHRSRALPGFAEASEWLRERRPLDFEPGLMHGDPQFANAMFLPSAPARLSAFVDWEMATIGDPKLDLAWIVHSWPEDGQQAPAVGTSAMDLYDLDGMPSRTVLIEQYARQSGRQVDDIDFYLVLARWKFALMLEANFANSTGEKAERIGDAAVQLMRSAAELAASSTFARCKNREVR